MTTAEKKFNELLPKYLAAYQAANGKPFGSKIIYRAGYVIECSSERGFRERIGTFEQMLNNLKKRINENTNTASP
jgi:hypothetical protein